MSRVESRTDTAMMTIVMTSALMTRWGLRFRLVRTAALLLRVPGWLSPSRSSYSGSAGSAGSGAAACRVPVNSCETAGLRKLRLGCAAVRGAAGFGFAGAGAGSAAGEAGRVWGAAAREAGAGLGLGAGCGVRGAAGCGSGAAGRCAVSRRIWLNSASRFISF